MPVMQRRARDTRTSLLQAAADVFADVGYTEANVADIVARAGSSVGSMYHHFGGKADLFLALYDDYQSRQEERADAAVLEARVAGEHEPLQLFLIGARAVLRGCWEERQLARLFLTGDGPPGFERVALDRFAAWVKRVGGLLRTADGLAIERVEGAAGEAYVLVLTTVISAAGREVTSQLSQDAASSFAEAVLDVLGRLAK